MGITPFWCINHGTTMSMYYHDPDGNIIETQYDTMSVDDADAFLGSEAYVINPIGVDFDPEDLSRRLEAGEAKRRGPYKKGKSVREKELERLVEITAGFSERLYRRNEDAGREQTNPYSDATSFRDAPAFSSTAQTLLLVRPPPVATASVSGSGTTWSSGASVHRDLDQSPLAPTSEHGARSHHLDNTLKTTVSPRLRLKEGLFRYAPLDQILEMWQIYVTRVNPTLKVIHCASFADDLLMAARRIHEADESLQILICSICFASLNALEDEEVTRRFGGERNEAMTHYEVPLQKALERKDLLEHPSIHILQAIVIYVVRELLGDS